jgi:signal transduction histidine kinase/DNA-binding response OmpR family regulator
MLPGLELFQIFNDKGDAIDSLKLLEHAENWAHSEYFNAHQRESGTELRISQPVAVKNPVSANLPFSLRRSNPDGSFAGVVVCGLRFSYVRELFERLTLGTAGAIALFRSDGTVLTRLPSDANTTGWSLGPSAPLTRAVQAGAGQMTLDDPIDHVRRQFTFRRVGNLPLVVGVGLSREQSAAGSWIAVTVFAGAMLVLLAITAALRSEQESRRRAAVEHRTKDEIRHLSTVSHELRGSLHGLLGSAEQLQTAADVPDPLTQRVDAIVSSARQLREFVDQLLDYWQFGTNGPEPHMRRTDLPELLRDCFAIAEPEARAKSLEFRYSPAPDAPQQFVTDRTLLHLVVMNLLTNAIKFTRHGAIELRYAGNVDRIGIEVADTGPGIRPDQRHMLFREFERLGADKMGIKGTGLGLSIADHQIRRMSGKIGHHDNPEGGSIFWVELPAGVAEEPAAQIDEAASPLDHPLQILIVDDSAVHRDLGTVILTHAGHNVLAAADGGDGVRLADSEDFDVILMDMRMPELSGLDAVRQIRALQGRRRAVPIIAVTADALDADREEYRRLGLVDHLSKPFAAADLLAMIAKVVRRHAPTPTTRIRPLVAANETPVLDVATLGRFEDSIGREATVRHMTELSTIITTLLESLNGPHLSGEPDMRQNWAHTIIGDAGTLGFVALATAACQLVSVSKHDPDAAPAAATTLREVAEESQHVLHQQLESLRRALVHASNPLAGS